MRALMPGSYDPVTAGHLAVIASAAARYDEVTVAVFINPKKQGLFGGPVKPHPKRDGVFLCCRAGVAGQRGYKRTILIYHHKTSLQQNGAVRKEGTSFFTASFGFYDSDL